MRLYDNGSGFTVAYSLADSEAFARQWPCSTVWGRGSFSFAENGDLVDVSGSASTNDGPDWLAFSQDCQAYGEERRARVPASQINPPDFETAYGLLWGAHR